MLIFIPHLICNCNLYLYLYKIWQVENIFEIILYAHGTSDVCNRDCGESIVKHRVERNC
jgi:hypothetical protein